MNATILIQQELSSIQSIKLSFYFEFYMFKQLANKFYKSKEMFESRYTKIFCILLKSFEKEIIL